MNLRTAAVTTAVLLLLSASGCGFPGGDAARPYPSSTPPVETPTATGPVTELASAAPGTPGPPQPTPSDPSQPGPGAQLGTAVATRTASADGLKLTMVLYPILRDTTTSSVTFSLSSPARNGDYIRLGGLLSDGDNSALDSTGYAADGIQLVDGKRAKLYLVATDGRGGCACSRGLMGVELHDDASVLISATFAAPPAGVTTMDVRVPNFGTVTGVPVQ